MIVKNKKTEIWYMVLYIADNANNGFEGQKTVVYKNFNSKNIYTRDLKEFCQKFINVEKEV